MAAGITRRVDTESTSALTTVCIEGDWEMHDDSYELFRRAVEERDADAWAAIAERYRNLMIVWVVRCPSTTTSRESVEDLADRVLTQAWKALTPERFAAFPSTATLMGYLRSCVISTVIDAARAQVAYERAIQHGEEECGPMPEPAVIERLGRDELWELVNQLVTSETERVALVERFVLDLPPREIQARHPALFTDVSMVYKALRNLCVRLRRNPELQRLYAERYAE